MKKLTKKQIQIAEIESRESEFKFLSENYITLEVIQDLMNVSKNGFVMSCTADRQNGVSPKFLHSISEDSRLKLTKLQIIIDKILDQPVEFTDSILEFINHQLSPQNGDNQDAMG